jgi:hypothetical protein
MMHQWEQLFGCKRRTDDEAITQKHCNLALAIQEGDRRTFDRIN